MYDAFLIDMRQLDNMEGSRRTINPAEYLEQAVTRLNATKYHMGKDLLDDVKQEDFSVTVAIA